MHPHYDYRPLSRRARLLAAATAVVGSLATLAAVLIAFHDDGTTPWVGADQAALVAHCEPTSSATQRHECLQAAARERGTTRVAAR
jgi:hypothetical protein